MKVPVEFPFLGGGCMLPLRVSVDGGNNREARKRDSRMSELSRKDTGSLASDYDDVQRNIHQKSDFPRRW